MATFVDLLFVGIGLGAIYSLLGMSFALIFRVTHIFHFAHGGVFAIAAYAYYSISTEHGLPAVAGVGGALAIAAIVGVVIYALLYRPLERRRTKVLGMFVTSLGLLIIIENALSLIFTSSAKYVTANGLAAPLLRSGDIVVRRIDALEVGVAVLVIGLVALMWNRTRVGLVLRSIETNKELAEALGVPYERFAATAFALGSLVVSVAAVLQSLTLSVTPFIGTSAMISAFVAMVIGGTGSIWAAAAGGLILGIAQTVPLEWISGSWIDAVSFGLLIAVLLLKPNGLVSGVHRPRRRARSGSDRHLPRVKEAGTAG